MYRMSLMAFTTPEADVDKTHAMKLALVHDLAEALVGDITPHDGVSKQDKYDLESRAMHKIKEEHFPGDNNVGDELIQLWTEYENGESKEAKFVKQLDKLEMIVQADEYEREQKVELSDFFESTKGVFTSPVLKNIDEALRQERKKRCSTHDSSSA